ncbi:MAG: SBBP repeat-containing protein, partial [Candidatus Latescibacteria bacterium]|nr:SBBP repeat-containing protein [Candidatus Latescibacterota bacterium]
MKQCKRLFFIAMTLGIVVSLHAQIDTVWTRRYDGIDRDYVYAMTVDGQGNVYVTGSSKSSSSSYTENYLTIKYNANGVQQWAVPYNGPGVSISTDEAYSVAVDQSGNVYVTGKSYGAGTDYNYATIKYNANGVEQWVRRYNGPGNSADVAKVVAVDKAGNICVIGYSIGSGSSSDYTIIKYDSSGVELWVQRYNGPGNIYDVANAMVLDEQDNIYVTGGSSRGGTNYDYATIKYNSLGQERWVARYNGPANGSDNANAVTVDRQGNVYVTGASASSSVSPFNNDILTIKYDSMGAEQWVRRYDGPGNDYDYASAIAIDGQGNVVVTGASRASSSSFSDDYVTIKYDANGVEQWVQRYNGPGNSSDWSNALVIDSYNNIYVTGYSSSVASPTSNFDYATIKYSPNGIEQWVQRYDGPASLTDQATRIALAGQDIIYVSGNSTGVGTLNDYFTIKYRQDIHDISITEIVQPTGVIDSTSKIAPKVKVKNNGNMVESFFDVFFDVSSGYSNSKSVTNLGIGEERIVEFDSMLVGPRGTYTTRCSTYLANDVNPADNVLRDSFTVIAYNLNVSVIGNGSVDKNPDQPSYAPNSLVQLTANPDTGWHFTGWTGDTTGINNPVTVTTNSDKNITANFEINAYDLTVNIIGDGEVGREPNQTNYNHGTWVKLTAAPNPGWHFMGWSDSLTGSNNPDSILMNSDKVVTATFAIDTFTIVSSVAGNGTIDPLGTVYVTYGSNQAYNISPDIGYHIDSVVVDGVNQGVQTVWAFNSINANHTIVAYFSINTYAITASAIGNGTIIPSGVIVVNYGSDTLFTFAPAIGYHLDSLMVDGINHGADSTSYEFTSIDDDHTIDAYFSINAYTITASASTGGTIIPIGAISVNYGEDTTFSIVPDIGHHLDSLLVDGINHGADSTSYEFTSIDDDHTIAVYFLINTYTITASASTGGTIIPIGAISVNYGEDTTFSIIPDIGHHLDSLLVDGINHGADSTAFTFENITDDHTITAYFSINTYNLTININPSASGTVETDPPVGPYNHGIYVKLTAHPVDGYYFTDWTGGLTSTNIYDSILMNSEQTVNANFTLIPGW